MNHRASGPTKVRQHYGTGLNSRIAVFITRKVGTMWCAYAFALGTVLGFPGLLGANALQYVLFASSVFLQLTLLPIIIVGQNVQAAAADARALATYNDVEVILTAIRQTKGEPS
jgi:hypothetical protein